MNNIRYLLAGDSALLMEFGNEVSKQINANIRQTLENIEKKKVKGIIELIPTYRSITVEYNPLEIKYNELVKKLDECVADVKDDETGNVRLIELPTAYGGEFGPDIGFVAEHSGLSEEEVIKIHAGTDYLVYMLGFIPGFTYLGGMDERIATPRLKSPRLKIEAGSVGIAGTQTGTYPSESPGGWQIIGRTPLKLYDETKEPPVFINAGDYIRYIPISAEEFEKIKKEVEAGTYQVKITEIARGELHG